MPSFTRRVFSHIEGNRSTDKSNYHKNEQQSESSTLKSCLESLPNELLFIIAAYLNSFHLVQAFDGLNQRFNSIVCELSRHFIISKDLTEIGFLDCKAHIRHVIEKICFDIQIVSPIFLSTHSYSNLRSIVLTYSDIITVDLNVDNDSLENTIRSYLSVLRICNIVSEDRDNANDQSKFSADLICTSIKRLSINSCSEEALLSICALAPNMTYLKVKQLVSSDDSSKLNSIFALITPSLSLKQLHISSTSNRLPNVHLIGQLISHYHASLEQLTLEILLNHRPDEYHLQKIFEPCRHLQKLSFALNYWREESEEIDVLHQFQTDWWRNPHQPPVLIFCSNHRETLIVSMPCSIDDYIWFPVDPKEWLVNKGQIDSSEIRFPKQKCLRFANTNHQLITLDFMHLIRHVFQATKQELSIPHGEFDKPDLLLEQLLNTRDQEPLLSMIHSIDLNSCHFDQLDAKTLIIWLLLASNAKILNICQGSTSAKIQLINRLQALIEEDVRFRSITESIEEVHVFYMFDSVNYTTKQHICRMYSNIFRNPVIRR